MMKMWLKFGRVVGDGNAAGALLGVPSVASAVEATGALSSGPRHDESASTAATTMILRKDLQYILVTITHLPCASERTLI